MIPLNKPTASGRGDGNLHPEILAICLVILSALVTGCGSTTELSSSWSSSAVTVDGSASEWRSQLTTLKDTHVSFGIQNDQEYLYVCLMSAEPQFRRQVLGLGLTVWFESENGEKLGVQYPIGVLKQGTQGSFGIDGNRDPEERERMAEQSLQDLEILGPGKEDRNLLSTVQVPGLSVKLGGSEGSVIYELKVPLRRSPNHPYAVGVAPGSSVKLAIQTGKFEGGMRQGNETGGMRGGGRRGGGGPPREGLPPGGGRPGREGSGSRPEPLDFSAHVRLAGTALP